MKKERKKEGEREEKRAKKRQNGLREAKEDETNFLCHCSQWDPGKVAPQQNAK